ncbi:MAG: PucR family transcriptional regulator ligand-binding domain-containing protein [Oscillospiraceae bacterium]|nr:PucR family transcriptional regulator ligand-binding domain-containing protein [Oscillospiraceae bacterium]
MNIKCRNLSELKCFERISLVAGEGGLDHIISWVYINQDVSVSDWIHGGELVFITGMEDGFSDKNLISITRECVENAASGIVILINPEHIREIPREVIEIAENEDMPLYEMPWELKLVDVTKEIADMLILNRFNERSIAAFFSGLLFTNRISLSSVRSMGIHCGVDVDSDAAMLIIRPVGDEDLPQGDYDNILSSLSRTIENSLYAKGINIVISTYMNEIFGYMVCNNSELSVICKELNRICNDFFEKQSGAKIYGGIGRADTGAESFRKSYAEAKQTLEAAESSSESVHIALYSQLGIIRLLTAQGKTEELRDYCYTTLMPLIDSDKQRGTEYVKTLEVYLNCNCNLVKAAEDLFVHRNTMVYRVEKIKSLLEIDFNDMTAKSECVNALRIMRHFGINLNDF